MDQLPHHSSPGSSSSLGSPSGLTHHSTTITTLPITPALSASRAANAEGSSSTSQTRPPRLPQRPSFSRRQRFSPRVKSSDPSYTQLASHIAKVQAQPHKPKRPSPLHVSVSPSTLEADELCDSSGSEGESSPEVPDLRTKLGLSPVVEETGNMLGLDLDGYSWTCELQERMKEPKTPFPSPAILV